MNREEFNNLKVGDKVRWVSSAGTVPGEIVERLKGKCFRLRWEDGHTEVLNPRSSHDRTRAKNIQVVLAAAPPAST